MTAQTDRRIDPQRITGYLHTAVVSLVEALEEAPQSQALSLPILPESERRQVIELFNATETAYPQDRLIHELFEEQVERTPAAVAVMYEDQSLTYAELNAKANQLASYLREQGVTAGQLIPILMPRSLQMLIGQLAVLKIGAAYVPIDPEFPVERQAFMLRDCAARWALVAQEPGAALEHPRLQWIDCTAAGEQIGQAAEENPGVRLERPAVAYVMYTSGSTGEPKGVMVPHHAVNRLVINNGYTQIEPSDCVAHGSNPAFDASTFEIWGALLNGARVAIIPPAVVLDGQSFAQTLQRHRVTVLWLTAGLFTQSVQSLSEVFGQLRYLLVGGDVVNPEAVREVLRGSRPRHLLNGYGPTEGTTFSATYEIETVKEDGAGIPIGRPIANTRIYILDARLNPVPIGVPGELYIAGAGVALGYLQRDELTVERFLRDPFSTDPSAEDSLADRSVVADRAQGRMYKTGDLGRWRADGAIEYLGRNDHQVKIRGFRVELGEIEAQLLRHGQIQEAVVIAREDVPGEKRLVAYVVAGEAAATSPAVSVERLRESLKPVLPDYMVPSAMVLLESLPLTANGKLDRRALPAPEQGAYGSRAYEAPRGEIEEILSGIWQELLRVERVGRSDNFFELGGHSLLIVQMLERLRRVGLSAQVRGVFESATLADLAATLTQGVMGEVEVPPNLIPAGCERITPQMLPLVQLEGQHIERIVQAVPGGAANIQDIYPLSSLQEGILFHHLLNPEGADVYARVMLFSLTSQEHLTRLLRALQAVIDRHDILRTAVLWEQLPQMVQVVYRQASLPVEEIALQPQRPAQEQLEELMQGRLERLDLRQAPLMRVHVAADPHSQQWYALLQTHHLVCDNGSLEILSGEAMAFIEERAQALPAPVPYRNHVAQTLGQLRSEETEAFFRSRLGDVEEPTAPFGLLDVQGDGSQAELVYQTLPDTLARRVRLQARRLGVSVATVFHAAWALVLAHTSAREDVVFGSVLLGRLQSSAGAQRILGMFINTLPLRLRLQQVSARELVEQTQRELIELLVHEQASLAVAQRCSGIAGSTGLFSALLN